MGNISIRHLRERKNFTQEYVAYRLGITQNSYSKIETGQTRLTTDRAKELAEIFEVPVESIISDDVNVFNVHNSTIDKFYIENLQENNKDLIASIINQTEFLQKEIERLTNIIDKLSDKK